MGFNLPLVVIINLLGEGDPLMVSQRRIRFRIASLVSDDDFPLFAQDLVLFDQRSLDGYFGVAEKVVWVDFGVFGLFKVGVEFGYLTDMSVRDENALVSEIPFHLIEEIDGVNQLNLILPCLRFSVVKIQI